MAFEIERKFLVSLDKLELPESGQVIKQGYIGTSDKTAVRIRRAGDKAFLTIKGENKGSVRSEFEYAIPVEDAEQILEELCQRPFIEKTRYLIDYKGHTWELDIFAGDNAGLVVVEIELQSKDEVFEKPDWLLEDVTDDSRYYNSSLVDRPYKSWSTS